MSWKPSDTEFLIMGDSRVEALISIAARLANALFLNYGVEDLEVAHTVLKFLTRNIVGAIVLVSANPNICMVEKLSMLNREERLEMGIPINYTLSKKKFSWIMSGKLECPVSARMYSNFSSNLVRVDQVDFDMFLRACGMSFTYNNWEYGIDDSHIQEYVLDVAEKNGMHPRKCTIGPGAPYVDCVPHYINPMHFKSYESQILRKFSEVHNTFSPEEHFRRRRAELGLVDDVESDIASSVDPNEMEFLGDDSGNSDRMSVVDSESDSDSLVEDLRRLSTKLACDLRDDF